VGRHLEEELVAAASTGSGARRQARVACIDDQADNVFPFKLMKMISSNSCGTLLYLSVCHSRNSHTHHASQVRGGQCGNSAARKLKLIRSRVGKWRAEKRRLPLIANCAVGRVVPRAIITLIPALFDPV